jgi:hypothetical protein
MSRLIPDELKAQMIRNHYDVTEEHADDHPPVVKLFAGNATCFFRNLIHSMMTLLLVCATWG